jgi:hypothetical protein
LVEEKARLLALQQISLEAQPRFEKTLTPQSGRAGRRLHGRVRAVGQNSFGQSELVARDVLNVPAQPQHQRVGLQGAPEESAHFAQPRQPRRGVKLQNPGRIVTVQDQARPTVVLAVDGPITRGLLIE